MSDDLTSPTDEEKGPGPAPSPPPISESAAANETAPPDGGIGEVVDDLDARRESQEWAIDQLTKGRTPEEVEAELVASGWPQDDAAEMAEDARKETRHLRGVVTREDVSRSVEANYRRSLRRLPLIAFGGLPGIFITFSNVLRSLAGMRKLKEMTQHREEDEPPGGNDGG